MNLIHWYDFITPTTPFAALFFGITFVLIVTLFFSYKEKSKKSAVVLFLVGTLIVLGIVGMLESLGFY
ncbi:hypothetical protein [Pseudomonas sp. 2822-17]|uniref:hypothetical protein n=1 Tax=Pseudomonas sp. 2822-17 TaxID=1712678 RepID=UPI00117BB4EC|nr:hypothetical protein [Pseudomonas sp. 2822-17]